MIIKRLEILTCLLIITLMLPYSASESTTEVRHDLKSALALLQQNQTLKMHADNHNETMEGDKWGERGQEKVEVDVDVVKKTKGTYGGGDLLRPRSKTSGAQPNCLAKPSYIFFAILPLFIA